MHIQILAVAVIADHNPGLLFDVCCLQPTPPTIALLSQFPTEYNGPTADLRTEHAVLSNYCEKSPSVRLVPTTLGIPSILTPGWQSICADLPTGNWLLFEGVAPSGTAFDHWECYNTTGGTSDGPMFVEELTMVPDTSYTCVAVYTLLDLPKLAIMSRFQSDYTGPTANLAANRTNPSVTYAVAGPDSCSKPTSSRLNSTVAGVFITVVTPGRARCGIGNNGIVQAGTYNLSQTPPPNTQFFRWECYDISTGTAVPMPVAGTLVTLAYRQAVSCVAIYCSVFNPEPCLLPDSPSPSPSSSPSPSCVNLPCYCFLSSLCNTVQCVICQHASEGLPHGCQLKYP